MAMRGHALAWYGVGADTDWIPADCSDTSNAGHGAKFGRGKVCTDTYTAAAAAYTTTHRHISLRDISLHTAEVLKPRSTKESPLNIIKLNLSQVSAREDSRATDTSKHDR